jgi:hypothetical protein
MSRFCAVALVAGSLSRVLVSQRRTRSCHGASGCVSVHRGHRRRVQRLIEYLESALRRGGVSARFAITHAPYQRVLEKVFYPFTRIPRPVGVQNGPSN